MLELSHVWDGQIDFCFAAKGIFRSPCGSSLHASDTDVSNPTRWLILTGSGYACAKVAVCPEQPSHFNSHPPQSPDVVVVAKPTDYGFMSS